MLIGGCKTCILRSGKVTYMKFPLGALYNITIFCDCKLMLKHKEKFHKQYKVKVTLR